MPRFRTTIVATVAAVTSIVGFGAAPTAEASPLWRGDSWLVPNDGDSGGISTGLNAWMYHDESHRARSGFASKGEYVIAANYISRDTRLWVCTTVKVYTIEGRFLAKKEACQWGYGYTRINWTFDEGYPTRVTLQVKEGPRVLYQRTQTGGRT